MRSVFVLLFLMPFLPFSLAHADDVASDPTSGPLVAAPKAFQQIRVDLQKNATILSDVIEHFKKQGSAFMDVGKWLFGFIATLGFLWGTLERFKGGNFDLREYAGYAIYHVAIVMLFLFIFYNDQNDQRFVEVLMGFGLTLFQNASPSIAYTSIEEILSISGFFTQVTNAGTAILFDNYTRAGTTWVSDLGVFILKGILFVVIVFLASVSLILLLVLYIRFYFLSIQVSIYAAFIGANFTADIAKRFIFIMLGSVFALLIGLLWHTFMFEVLVTSASNMSGTISDAASIIVVLLLYWFGMTTFPSTAEQIIANSVSGVYQAANSIVGGAAAGAAAGAASVALSTIKNQHQKAGLINQAASKILAKNPNMSTQEAKGVAKSLFSDAAKEMKSDKALGITSGASLADKVFEAAGNFGGDKQ